ncbi:MAG: hypothetical protein SGJ23_02450 [Alphaproteobacteria bacterium]|nr:hypothetical protein [Alphaproteobacteria bacterium]
MQIVRPLRHRREAYAAAARDLHLWLLQVLAWLMARVPAPRFLRLDFRRDIRKTRAEIRTLIFLSMCARMTFHVDRTKYTRRPHGIDGYQRRRIRLLRWYTRGVPLRTVADMRDALKDFDKTVKRALARLPRKGGVLGAVVAVVAVSIALSTDACAPAAEAADTS